MSILNSFIGVPLSFKVSLPSACSRELHIEVAALQVQDYRSRGAVRCMAESAGVLSDEQTSSSTVHFPAHARESRNTIFTKDSLHLSDLDTLRRAAYNVTTNENAVAHATTLARAALTAAKEAQAYANQAKAAALSKRKESLAFKVSLELSEQASTELSQLSEVKAFSPPAAFKKALDRARNAQKERQLMSSSSNSAAIKPNRRLRTKAKEDSMEDIRKIADLLRKIQLEEMEAETDSFGSNFRHESITNQELKRGKLLTGEEEILLTKGVQEYLRIERCRVSLSSAIGRDPSQTELAKAVGCTAVELTKRLTIGQECKQTMIRHNLRLVYSVAKNYVQKGVSIDDLVSEGCKGLIRGLEKFDYTKGFKFSTYAHWWIRQAVNRSAADQSRTIRLPAHMYELVGRIFKAREMIQEECRRPAKPEEIAQLVGITVRKLSITLESLRKPKLASTKVYRDSEETVGDLLSDPNAESMEEVHMTKVMLKKDIESVLHTLNPRERDVMRLRYGLADGKPKTLEEVGLLFQVTRERIRQIENKALRKLKQPSRNKLLREYVGKAPEADLLLP